MTYGRLGPYLHDKGFALHQPRFVTPYLRRGRPAPRGTHGSGVRNGNLSTAVSAMELVTPDGDVVSLSRDKDGGSFLGGSVVHLGAAGVVTKVMLDIRPTFAVSQEVCRERLPMAQLAAGNIDAIMSAGYSVGLFTDWQKGRISEVWVKRRVEEEGGGSDAVRRSTRVRRGTFIQIIELSAENCTEQMGVPGPLARSAAPLPCAVHAE